MVSEDRSEDGPALSPEWLRAVFEATSGAVFLTERDGTVVDANGTATTRFGDDRARLQGSDLATVLAGDPPYTADRVRERIDGLAPGDEETFAWRAPGADGAAFWAEITLATTTVAGDTRLVATVRDAEACSDTDRRFGSLLSNLPGMVYRCRNEADWPMEYVGGQCEALTGYEAAAIESGAVSWGTDVIHPADRERVREPVQTAIDRGERFEVTYRILTADDRTRWVWERGQQVEVPGADSPRLEGFITDVTERTQLEEELRQYRQAVEGADTPIAAVDADARYLFANEAYRAIHAPDRADLTGVALEAVLDDEVAATAESYVQDVIDGEIIEYETTRVHPEDGEREFAVRYYPVEDQEGEIRGIVGLFHDITARNERRAELQAVATRLEEEREKYSTVVRKTHDGIAIIQDREFAYLNPQLKRLTGYEAADLEDVGFLELVAPEDRETVAANYERRLDPEGSPPARYELTFVTADGERRVGQVSAARIQYDGAPAVLFSIRDVTDRTEYERRLERQRDNLEMLNQVVRHDIRNDLQLVTAYAELVAADVAADTDRHDHLATIVENADHAVALTETARDLTDAMLEEGGERRAVPLREELQAEIEEARSAYASAVLTVDGPLPEVEVLADDLLDSVFRNLLRNAVQHNDDPVPEVTVSVAVEPESVEVRIADNGPGVPDDRKAAIFGKGETALDSEGTGVGLYLVRTLVDRYRGEVHVEDRTERTSPGDRSGADDFAGGSVFVVRLQRAG